MREMESEDIKTLIRLGGYMFGAVFYIVIFYTIITMGTGNDLSIIIHFNKYGEAWWELLIYPTVGLIIFLGLFFEFQKWLKELKSKD